ncbi:MAG: hypothetical protein ACLSVD_13355 [Eggerthellaceae bacterium]
MPSIVLSTFAFGGLPYGFSSASTLGWGNAVVVDSIVGRGRAAWFIHRQRIESRCCSCGLSNAHVHTGRHRDGGQLGAGRGQHILPIYPQNVLGLTAFETGILMTPGAVATIFLSPVSGMLFDRPGRVIAIVGLTGLTASLAFVLRRRQDDGRVL